MDINPTSQELQDLSSKSIQSPPLSSSYSTSGFQPVLGSSTKRKHSPPSSSSDSSPKPSSPSTNRYGVLTHEEPSDYPEEPSTQPVTPVQKTRSVFASKNLISKQTKHKKQHGTPQKSQTPQTITSSIQDTSTSAPSEEPTPIRINNSIPSGVSTISHTPRQDSSSDPVVSSLTQTSTARSNVHVDINLDLQQQHNLTPHHSQVERSVNFSLLSPTQVDSQESLALPSDHPVTQDHTAAPPPVVLNQPPPLSFGDKRALVPPDKATVISLGPFLTSTGSLTIADSQEDMDIEESDIQKSPTSDPFIFDKHNNDPEMQRLLASVTRGSNNPIQAQNVVFMNSTIEDVAREDADTDMDLHELALE